ncbi:MAG: hypothetical protein LBT43_00560 [Prevotella sp.]|jgi:RHS repeat-associated protein|nr:hypothetical protein [Prevotella sp.]
MTDFVLDIYHAQYRFYDAKNRTFTSKNPAEDGLNWYRYVDGNPATRFDPLGLNWWDDFVNWWNNIWGIKGLL